MIPFEKIKNVGHIELLEKDLFTVSWIIGRFCNYKCSYCWPHASTQKPDHLDLETYSNAIDEIKKQARKNEFNNFHFSFTGGEPTAFKNFDKLIQYYVNDIESQNNSLHITTNLSPSLQWWKRWANYTDRLKTCGISASFHHEFADESEFTKKCLFLQDNGINVIINQVMTVENFFDHFKRCERFYNSGLNVSLKPQSNIHADQIVSGYTTEMLDLMKNSFPQKIDNEEKKSIKLVDLTEQTYYVDQAERLNAFGFNKFTNWNCSAGFQSCIISNNEVRRGHGCNDLSLGTLTEGFSLFNKEIPCITNKCICSADLKVPKKND